MPKRRLLTALTTIGLCGTLLACGQPQIDDQGDDAGYAAFRATVYQEPDSGVFIVDGDTPIADEEGLRAFYAEHVRQGERGVRRQGLIVSRANGADVKWSATDKRNIQYCISPSFGFLFNTVRDAMAAAALPWRLSADVNFVYRPDQTANCDAANANVTFNVEPVSGQPYLARSFFPDQPRSMRSIRIDTSSFGDIGPYTLAGILRHELGHALGFRHEHTRPETHACFEDNNWRALTPYDAGSVMHYPQCYGTQRGDLTLTDKDKAGAAALYGPACGILRPNTQLALTQSVTSCNGQYKLVMQTDQNLVLYKSGNVALWASNTWHRGSERVILQNDGNLVIYDSSNLPLWASNTAGTPGASLIVQDDGNVVIYNSTSPLWATNTVQQ